MKSHSKNRIRPLLKDDHDLLTPRVFLRFVYLSCTSLAVVALVVACSSSQTHSSTSANELQGVSQGALRPLAEPGRSLIGSREEDILHRLGQPDVVSESLNYSIYYHLFRHLCTAPLCNFYYLDRNDEVRISNGRVIAIDRIDPDLRRLILLPFTRDGFVIDGQIEQYRALKRDEAGGRGDREITQSKNG